MNKNVIRKDIRTKVELASLQGLLILLIAAIAINTVESTFTIKLFEATAFIIVFVGTIGAIMVSSSFKNLSLALNLAKWVLFTPKDDRNSLILEAESWMKTMKAEGALKMDKFQNSLDEFKNRGVSLTCDLSGEKIKEIMTIESDLILSAHKEGAKVWEKAAGFAPTIGILGAVLGLSTVMANMTDLAKLGPGIAQAFLATIYGVGLANFILLPIANKIKEVIASEYIRRAMMIEAWVMIANQESTMVLKEKLKSYTV